MDGFRKKVLCTLPHWFVGLLSLNPFCFDCFSLVPLSMLHLADHTWQGLPPASYKPQWCEIYLLWGDSHSMISLLSINVPNTHHQCAFQRPQHHTSSMPWDVATYFWAIGFNLMCLDATNVKACKEFKLKSFLLLYKRGKKDKERHMQLLVQQTVGWYQRTGNYFGILWSVFDLCPF